MTKQNKIITDLKKLPYEEWKIWIRNNCEIHRGLMPVFDNTKGSRIQVLLLFYKPTNEWHEIFVQYPHGIFLSRTIKTVRKNGKLIVVDQKWQKFRTDANYNVSVDHETTIVKIGLALEKIFDLTMRDHSIQTIPPRKTKEFLLTVWKNIDFRSSDNLLRKELAIILDDISIHIFYNYKSEHEVSPYLWSNNNSKKYINKAYKRLPHLQEYRPFADLYPALYKASFIAYVDETKDDVIDSVTFFEEYRSSHDFDLKNMSSHEIMKNLRLIKSRKASEFLALSKI